MSTSSSKTKVRKPIPYSWVIIFLGIGSFVLVLWARSYLFQARPSQLESIIAENEPVEHVHAVAVTPDGTTYVATHLGLIAGKGGKNWARVAGVTGDIQALHPAGPDGLYMAGEQIGVVRYSGGQSETLLRGKAYAMAVDPNDSGRLVAYLAGDGLHESRDGGKRWAKLVDHSVKDIYALAIDPRDSNVIVAGGLQGFLMISTDGGKAWSFLNPLYNTVSALAFDPGHPGKLWAAVGGAVQYSENHGGSWQPAPNKAGGRNVVSLTRNLQGGTLWVTVEGFLFTQ